MIDDGCNAELDELDAKLLVGLIDRASPDGGAEIGPAGCDMEKRWAVPFDDIEDEQIRSLWQTTDTGDIEDDILTFARSLLALAADRVGTNALFREVSEMLVADWEHEGDSAIGESVYLKAKAALREHNK